LLELLQKKAEGEPLPEPQADGGGEVVDLMEALRASVQATKKRRASSKAGSSSRTKTSASKSKSASAKKKPARKAS
jgi:DNA end-binding protein Ku